jgi:PAS domain S-box-containing protein
MNNKAWLGRMPVKIVLVFAVISALWISYSDAMLNSMIKDANIRLRYDVYLGLSYIAVISSLLYFLLQRYVSTIRQHEQSYQTLADSGQALIWASGTDKLCNYFNRTWLEFTGRPLEREMGNGWAEGVHPDDLQRCLDIYVSSFERREKFSMDYRLRRYDGEYRWLQDDGCPRYDSEGEFIGYIGFCLDISDGKQLELELAKNNEFMSAILDCLSDGVVVCDKDGRLSLFNRSAREFHGLPEQPIFPDQWAEYYDLYENDGTTRMKTDNIPLFKALNGEDVINQEMVVIPKGQNPLTLLATGRQLLNHAGEKLGAVISLHDVTMLIALEEQLRQSQKMESIGTLAGGVAHDFNNILTVIIGACTLLEMEVANDPEQLNLVTQISSSAERAAKLTQSLLAFSRRQTINRQSEDLGYILKVMEDFLGRIIGEDILLAMDLPDDPVMVMIDRGQIEQVLMNLAANVRDALPHGGLLNIGLSRVENRGGQIELEECEPGDYAMISVSDSGEGIDKATQQRIFEPFFTTKAVGKGTGLGLSMAYGIIRKHEGVIHVYSKPGEGTTFKIFLPLMEQRQRKLTAQSQKELPPGSETILLVEDDPEVLAMNKNLLEKAGYMVISAFDGLEALDLFKRVSNKIALVILDVIMPGMNGNQLYRLLRAIRPDVKVLFVSGYKADMLSRKGVMSEGINFLAKPLEPHLLLGKVRKLIEA